MGIRLGSLAVGQGMGRPAQRSLQEERPTTAPAACPQTALGEKQNKHRSEITLFPRTCYDTSTKCSLQNINVFYKVEGNTSSHPILLSLHVPA